MSRFKNLLLFIFFWRPLNNYLIGVYLNNLIFFSCNPHYSIGLQWLYLPTNQTARNKRWLSTNRQEIFQPNRNSAWSCSVFAGVFFQNIVIMKTMFTSMVSCWVIRLCCSAPYIDHRHKQIMSQYLLFTCKTWSSFLSCLWFELKIFCFSSDLEGGEGWYIATTLLQVHFRSKIPVKTESNIRGTNTDG